MNKFIIYATETCQYCKQAKALLEERGLPYHYKLLKTTKDLVELQEDFPGAKTVPQIITPEGKKIGGYDALLQLLG